MRILKALDAILLLGFASSAWAQDNQEAKKKPVDQPAVAAPAAGPAAAGPDTTTDTFGDWSIICTARGGDRACEVSTSIMLRNQTAPFARVAIVRPAKDKSARIIALVPVNVTAQSAVKIALDSGKNEISLPLRSCVPGGCIADADASKDLLQVLRTPAKAPGQLTIVDATGKPASVPLSLRGLDAALDAYFKQQDK